MKWNKFLLIILFLFLPLSLHAQIDPNLPNFSGNNQAAGFWRSGDGEVLPTIFVVNTFDWDAAASDSTRNVEGGGTWPVRQGGLGTILGEYENSGKKGIILFEVSGYIEPDNAVIFRINGNDYGLSILGGTSPIPGVILRKVMLRTLSGTETAKNVYMSHIRVYQSVEYPAGSAGSWRAMSSASPNVFIDHCEFIYGTDIDLGTGDNFGTNIGDVLVHDSIMAWGLMGSDHPDGPLQNKAAASSWDTWRVWFNRCLFAHARDRSPMLRTGSKIVTNCISYDWGIRPIHISTHGDDTTYCNLVGNLSIAGPETYSGLAQYGIYLYLLDTASRIYAYDNRAINGANTYVQSDASDWSVVIYNNSGIEDSVIKATDWIAGIEPPGFTPLASSVVEATVLPEVGAYPAYSLDTIVTLKNQVTNRTGGYVYVSGGIPYPSYPAEWSTGPTALTLPANPHSDYGDGYTNIEHWYWAIKQQIEGTGGSDTTPPERSGFSPTGTLASTITSTLVSWLTNEDATCQWNETGGLPFDDGGMTEATTTGGTEHSFTYSGLSPLDEVTIYIRCEDGDSNANTDDYIGSFNIGPPENLLNAETYSADSGNYDPNYPVENLWDDCIDRSSGCTSGKISETQLWVEFDLKALYALTKASIFGDYYGDWWSNTWTMKYKVNSGDSWSTAFSTQACQGNQWYHQSLSFQAQYVRFEINGPAAGTQAREIVLQGSQVGSGIPVGIGMMRSGGTGSGQVIDGGSYSAIQK